VEVYKKQVEVYKNKWRYTRSKCHIRCTADIYGSCTRELTTPTDWQTQPPTPHDFHIFQLHLLCKKIN
jgi:hypothetical protein